MKFDFGTFVLGGVAGFIAAGALAFVLMRVQHDNFTRGQQGVIESAYELRKAGTDEARVWEILREHARASRE